MIISDRDNVCCVFFIAVAVVLVTLIVVLGINYTANTVYQAELDTIKVRVGLPTSDVEARVIRLEKALEGLSREFRPRP